MQAAEKQAPSWMTPGEYDQFLAEFDFDQVHEDLPQGIGRPLQQIIGFLTQPPSLPIPKKSVTFVGSDSDEDEDYLDASEAGLTQASSEKYFESQLLRVSKHTSLLQAVIELSKTVSTSQIPNAAEFNEFLSVLWRHAIIRQMQKVMTSAEAIENLRNMLRYFVALGANIEDFKLILQVELKYQQEPIDGFINFLEFNSPSSMMMEFMWHRDFKQSVAPPPPADKDQKIADELSAEDLAVAQKLQEQLFGERIMRIGAFFKNKRLHSSGDILLAYLSEDITADAMRRFHLPHLGAPLHVCHVAMLISDCKDLAYTGQHGAVFQNYVMVILSQCISYILNTPQQSQHIPKLLGYYCNLMVGQTRYDLLQEKNDFVGCLLQSSMQTNPDVQAYLKEIADSLTEDTPINKALQLVELIATTTMPSAMLEQIHIIWGEVDKQFNKEFRQDDLQRNLGHLLLACFTRIYEPFFRDQSSTAFEQVIPVTTESPADIDDGEHSELSMEEIARARTQQLRQGRERQSIARRSIHKAAEDSRDELLKIAGRMFSAFQDGRDDDDYRTVSAVPKFTEHMGMILAQIAPATPSSKARHQYSAAHYQGKYRAMCAAHRTITITPSQEVLPMQVPLATQELSERIRGFTLPPPIEELFENENVHRQQQPPPQRGSIPRQRIKYLTERIEHHIQAIQVVDSFEAPVIERAPYASLGVNEHERQIEGHKQSCQQLVQCIMRELFQHDDDFSRLMNDILKRYLSDAPTESEKNYYKRKIYFAYIDRVIIPSLVRRFPHQVFHHRSNLSNQPTRDTLIDLCCHLEDAANSEEHFPGAKDFEKILNAVQGTSPIEESKTKWHSLFSQVIPATVKDSIQTSPRTWFTLLLLVIQAILILPLAFSRKIKTPWLPPVTVISVPTNVVALGPAYARDRTAEKRRQKQAMLQAKHDQKQKWNERLDEEYRKVPQRGSMASATPLHAAPQPAHLTPASTVSPRHSDGVKQRRGASSQTGPDAPLLQNAFDTSPGTT